MSELGLGKLTIDPKTNSPRMTSMSSDIDTEKLTQSLYEAKLIPATRIEQKIEVNDAKVKAYGELRDKLEEMGRALDGLRNPPGTSGLQDNLFERKAAYFTSDTATQPGALLGVQASSEADVGSFDLTIHDLATAHKTMSGAFTSADAEIGPAAAGTLTVGLGGGDTADIEVSADMTVYDLRDALNAQSATTGVDARVLKVADDDHRLVMTGDSTGAANTIDLSGPAPLTDQLQAETLSTARDAVVEVDGVTVERPDNTITDLMEGLTLDLYQAESATTVTVDVEPDFTEAKAAVQDFVEGYNGLRDFIAGQRVVDEDGEVDKLESPLFGDSLLRNLGQELAGEVVSAVDGLPAGAAATLAQVGISVGDGGRLAIDEGALDDALLQEPDAVRRVFEFRAETSDPGLSVYAHPDRLPSTSFEVRRTGADAWELDDGNRTLSLEMDGSALKAPEGSAYDGLTMFWTDENPPAGPIDVTATQGIADRLHGTISRALDATDGSVARAIDETDGQTARWRDDIAQIETRAEDYRLTLIDKFARLERALSLSESMLNQVRAQADAMTADG